MRSQRGALMKEERIRTYIRGLDEQLQGGIPEGHVVLIAGKPGTMKSSVAFNILYHNAKEEGLSGMYVTLEQNRDSLLGTMAGLGMDIKAVEKMVCVLDLGLIRKKLKQLGGKSWIEVFKMYVDNMHKTMNLDLMVIDSLPVLEVMSKFMEPREDLFRVMEWLRDLGITTFVIAEMEQGSDRFCYHGEDFLSDGIIHLDLRRDDNNVNLFLGVAKMRKTPHRRGYYPLIFDESGFEIMSQ